jgi:uncharacterized RDD family membrane protein YckC
LPLVSTPADADDDYAGRRLGLPASGPGSAAGWGRRLLALLIDWTMSRLVVAAFLGQEVIVPSGGRQTGYDLFLPIAVLGLEIWILTALLGGSAGQLMLGVAVRRTDGRPLDSWRALVRTILLLLVIPPVVYNRDRQGLHDLAVGSIAVMRR